MKHLSKLRPGFTLVELIVVITVIAILAAVVFVAVDPARRFQTARNSTRWSDVTTVVSAIKQYQADNGGSLPATATAIDSTAASVQLLAGGALTCSGAGAVTCAGQTVVSSSCAVTGLATDLLPYIKAIPKDPKTGVTGGDYRYYVNKDANGLITVGACDEEGEGVGGVGSAPVIEVSN
jgi:type IV pilus assembly protein PilA